MTPGYAMVFWVGGGGSKVKVAEGGSKVKIEEER